MTEDDAPNPSGPANPAQPYLLRGHAAVVAIPLVVFAGLLLLSPPGSGGGANIGLGFAGLPLIALGLPWSAIGMAAFDTFGPDRSFAHKPLLITIHLLVLVAPAAMNVVIHAGLYRWSRRRRGLTGPR